ncbi:hypothetical protein [Pseudomonas putida]|uniref:hypothetical protein n=1 Tax=Pseudomonas putida TaxID=303 RepID=UPI0037FC87D3
MKKALSALVLLALTAPCLAAAGETSGPQPSRSLQVIEPGPGKEILLVALTGVTFIAKPVGTEGVLEAYVKKWGSLSDGSGSFSKMESDVVQKMEDCRCSIRMPVRKDATGRMQPNDGVATIACEQPGGNVIVSEVPGFLIGTDRQLGLVGGDGEKGFFVPQTTLHIPLE